MADVSSRREARKLADRRNLVGLANDTKWAEFFKEIVRLGIPLEIKLLYEDEPTRCTHVWTPAANYLDSQYGPNLFVFIEWVRSNAVAEIASIIKTVGLEYSIDKDQITVYGYR
jgi:hypothetical protein